MLGFLTPMDPKQCPYCKKRLKSPRGVTQHINQSPGCLKQQQQEISAAQRNATNEAPTAGPLRRSQRIQSTSELHTNPPSFASGNFPPDLPDQEGDDQGFPAADVNVDSDGDHALRANKRVVHASEESDSRQSGSSESTSSGTESASNGMCFPNKSLLQHFRQYCREHHDHYLPLSKEDISSIKLLSVLKHKAPLKVHASIMEWHLKEKGVLREHEKLGDANKYHHWTTLMKWFMGRHNLSAMLPRVVKTKLPSSKAVVSVPIRDAGDCIVSLLTDPRFDDSDYLFFDDDPFAPPPENISHLADLNTGDAYIRTHEKLITKDHQVLLPIILYIDGATTGHFSDLPVTAVKLALGIHKRETRDKQHAWRELGFIPTIRKDMARGKKIYQESKHLEAEDLVVLEGEGDYAEDSDAEADANDEDAPVKAQDFHTMLSVILDSLVKLQKTGFIWDLVYKGKLYEKVEFVLFVPFVKCDTEEADLLCGKYLVRNRNISHICRYCHCPTDKADDPRAHFPLKMQPEIERLVKRVDLDGLKAISQQYIQNAWYSVTFHKANKCGIHGACPSEKLHAIQLGLFKYLRDIFFDRIGSTSALAEDINGLAAKYGKVFSRQSERDLPHTKFSKGIQKGKLMARDYRGVLLIMAAILRSTRGRELLFTRKKLGGKNGLRDWTLLVELMLEWEAYLCEKEMVRKDVKRLKKKHVFIMYVMRSVAKRSSGMGLKIMKFHAVLHLISDMLLCGVPTEFDTGSNESHHKESKHAAKLTQRNEETFNYQTAVRLCEFLCIDLAMEEVTNRRCVWQYFEGVKEEGMDSGSEKVTSESDSSGSGTGSSGSGSGSKSSETEAEGVETRTGGTLIRVFEDEENGGEPSFEFLSRSKSMHQGTWNSEVVAWLNKLQNLVTEWIPNEYLPIFTEHKRGHQYFRGHPFFRSSEIWRDWVLVDWGQGYGILPSHIWCFVQLENMPSGKEKLEFGGVYLTDGVYAVVETATYKDIVNSAGGVDTEQEGTDSDLFTPLLVDVEGVDAEGQVTGRTFYLANTDAFVAPCCVVPDIGGAPNAYFQVKARKEWSSLFVQWLRAPHQDDVMEWSDDEPETVTM